jgi:hypothetical protein
MKREDITRMAQEVGIDPESDTLCNYDGWVDTLVDFAVLVAAAEREACAKVCVKLYDKFSDDPDMVRLKARHAFVLDGCAAAIRARGQA